MTTAKKLSKALLALLDAAIDWREVDRLPSPPCTVDMLKASDWRLYAAVRAYADLRRKHDLKRERERQDGEPTF